MAAYKKRVLRIAVDLTSYTPGLVDIATQSSMTLKNNVGCEVRVAFFVGNPLNNGALADVSQFTSLKLQIAASQNVGATVYQDKAFMATPGIDSALTLDEWNNGVSIRSGFERACHAVFSFEGSELSLLSSGQGTGSFYATLHGSTADDAGDADNFGAGTITVQADALPASAGALQGSNTVPGAAAYDGSGHYSLATTIGQGYRWTKGANDTSVTNGVQTVTVDGSVFFSNANPVTLNGTAGQPVTAVVWNAPTMTADEVASYVGANSSAAVGIYTGSAVPNGAQVGSVGNVYFQIVAGVMVQIWVKTIGNANNTGWQ